MKLSAANLVNTAFSVPSRKRVGIVAAYSLLGGLSVVIGVAVACAPLAPIVPASGAAAKSGTPTISAKPTASTGERAGANRPTIKGERAGVLGGHDRMAWIALAGKAPVARVSATGTWQVNEQGGRTLLVRGAGAESWQVERKGGLLRISGDGGDATPWREGPFVARPTNRDSYVQFAGKRYRGELWFTATDTGVLVVNRLPVEDYLRGVVPIELGTRAEADRSALEAQAVAARSYSYIRIPREDAQQPRSGWHMVATVANQVYGGLDVEAPVVNSAVDATAGLVIQYGGLLVDAPYSASCGGRSSQPSEIWHDAHNEPYLQNLDDLNPATGRPYCDISPRANWTATFDQSQLTDVVMRHLRDAGAVSPKVGSLTGLKIEDRFPSGRVRTLQVQTERGDVTFSADEIRALFRDARGAILSSTYFSVDRESREHGHLTGVTLRGTGNGHGVGMCQWGAIGRARAGQDFRTILQHYYPGTVVGFVD
ncbi:MAG: SpoIID/LytB domain-containing protein [Gemmatimonas sp.]